MAGGAVAAAFAGWIHDAAGQDTIAIYASGPRAPMAAMLSTTASRRPARGAPARGATVPAR